MSLTSRILLALAAGLGGSILLSVVDRPPLLAIASAIEPLGTLWVSALQMTVIPLVASLLITGIASATEAEAMGRLGAKALVLFLILLTAAAALTALAAPPLFSWLSIEPATAASLRQDISMTSEGAVLPSLSQWITGLVPTNPIAAAAEGAMLPLLVFTILFGFAALHVAPASRELLVGFFRSVAEVMLVLVRWILVVAPIGVFGLALPLGLQMGFSAVGAIAYYVLVLSGLALTILFVLYPVAAALGGVPLSRFARAAAPAQAVAFSTQSSLASLPAMVEGAVARLDISPRTAGFVLPLAVSLLRITSPVWQILGALFIARLYGIDLSSIQVATVAVIAVVMSMAGVGLPGGAGMMVAVPAFLAVGLPPQGIGLLIAIMAVPDTILTAANVTAHMTVATVLGRRRAVQAAADRVGALEQPSAATEESRGEENSGSIA